MRVKYLSVFLCLLLSLASALKADETMDKLMKAGKYKEAIEHADNNLPPAQRSSAVWVQVARANEKLGLTEKALACFLVSTRSNPDDYASHLGAARIYNKLGQHDRALSMARKALDLKFTGKAAWEYADACIKLDRSTEARKALEKVIETDPGNVTANRELGNIYYDDRQYRQAVPLLKKSYETRKDPEVAYKLGKAMLESGDLEGAREFLKKALKARPGMRQAQLDLARTSFAMGDHAAAVEQYGKALPRARAEAGDYFNLAVAGEKTGDTKGAMNAYEQAIKEFGASRSTDALTARMKVGRAELKNNEYQSALGHFKFIKIADKDNTIAPDIHFLLAEAHEGLKQYDEAIASLEEAIKKDARNIEAYARLADMYKKNDMEQKAKATYEKMISLSPDDPEVYLILGQYNLKEENYSQAKDLFQKSNTLHRTPQALEGIAEAAAGLQKWDVALDAAESAIKLDPDRADARKVLAEAYMEARNYESAVDHLEFLVNKKPSDLQQWKNLALCYDKTGQTEKRAKADARIIALDKKAVDARMRQGEYLLKKKDLDGAYSVFRELSLLEPDNPEVFKNLYRVCKRTDRNEAALGYVKKYLELRPKDAVAQRDLGDLLYGKKDMDGALAAYRRALEIDPRISGFFERYAEIVIAKGEHDEAIRALKGKIRAGDATVDDYSTLGMIYQKKDMYRQAIENYQKALELDPQQADVLAALGESQAASGQTNEAIITYEQVLMMNPGATKEHKALGDLYMKAGKTEQAMKAYGKYMENVPRDNEVAKTVGMHYVRRKQWAEAVKNLEKISGKEAQNFELLLTMGEAYLNLKDYDKVIQTYEGLKRRNPNLKSLKMIYRSLGDAYEAKGNNTKAADAYASYIGLQGVRDADAAYKVALLQEKTNPAAAKRIYEKNTTTYPSDYRNYLRLGLMYAEDKETLDKSVAMFNRITSMADSIPLIWLKLAEVYGKQGRKDRELEAYRAYIKAEPQNPKANKRIGMILVENRKYKEGLIYLETASTLAPKDPEVLKALARGYAGTARPEEAIKALVKAKALEPKDLELRRELYRLYRRTGQQREAKQEIEELLKIDPSDNDTRLIYAQLLYDEKKYKEAGEAVENIMATAPSRDALMMLGKIQTAQKDYQQALATYDEVISMENYAPALYEKAELFRNHGKQLDKSPKWAETFYERALRADPEFGLAELGLARLQKLWKRDDLYMKHLTNAKRLSPNNPEIMAEWRKANK